MRPKRIKEESIRISVSYYQVLVTILSFPYSHLFPQPCQPFVPLFLIPIMTSFKIWMEFFGRSHRIISGIHGSRRTNIIIIPPTEPTRYCKTTGKVRRIIITHHFQFFSIGSTIIIEIMRPATSAFLHKGFMIAQCRMNGSKESDARIKGRRHHRKCPTLAGACHTKCLPVILRQITDEIYCTQSTDNHPVIIEIPQIIPAMAAMPQAAVTNWKSMMTNSCVK